MPRKIVSKRGLQFNWVGAVAPGTVSGRRAHPPKAEKELKQKINVKERKKAISSAIAATAIKDIVAKRNHKFKEVPLVINKNFEHLSKTKDVIDTLNKLGLNEELKRISKKKVRAGKGKSRGRPYKKKKGPLLVVANKCELQKAAKSLQGIEITTVKSLNAELLAPGAEPGRLTVWSEGAIEKLAKEKLFM